MSAIKMAAKFAGKCSKCGKGIVVGAMILWAKGSPASHVECGTATTTTQAPRNFGAPRSYRGIESRRQAWGAARGMGPGHGSASPVRGYSSYCTDNDSCRCFDCAS